MMDFYSRGFFMGSRYVLILKEVGKLTHVKRFSNYRPKNLDAESYLRKKQLTSISFTGYCFLIVPATCFYLAAWQVRRRKWKEDLIAALSIKPKLPVIDLPDNLTDRARLEYRRVRVKGTFDHANEMYLGIRTRLDEEEPQSKGFLFSEPGSSEKGGYFVITPMKLSDRNLTILVNRGWVPQSKKDPNTRLEGQIEGEIELEGLVRLKEEDSMFLQDFDPKSRTFKFRDLAGMAELANTSFLYIDATKESTVPGGPIGGQTVVTLRNQHLSYIFTWGGMGVVTACMWIKKFVLRKS